MRTRIKICGITRPEDALEAVRLGADAIGLVFYPPSPRYVTLEQARVIASRIPPFVSIVGLFVDALETEIRRVLAELRIDVLQFHGQEPAVDCERYAKPYIKALRMQTGVDVLAEAATYVGAGALLLDTYRPGTPGGTGQVFDWQQIPRDLSKPLILAGGLTAENVAEAITLVRPYAVDVSGGVEAGKGIKDPKKMLRFIQEVERVGAA